MSDLVTLNSRGLFKRNSLFAHFLVSSGVCKSWWKRAMSLCKSATRFQHQRMWGFLYKDFLFLKSTLNKINNKFSIIFCTLLLMTHRLITHSKNVWMKMKWRFRPIVRSHRRLILRWNRNSHVPWSMIFIFIVSQVGISDNRFWKLGVAFYMLWKSKHFWDKL